MIEQGLGDPWPDAVRQAVQRFRQGHLIERPPLFYTAHLGYPIWSLSGAVAAEEEEDVPDALVELEREQRPAYGILTSQDCDISEEGGSATQPWVQVAPVYLCPEGSRLADRDFVIRLDPPALKGTAWIADMRIEMALEKSVLVGREPIEAFPAEDDYYRFSDLLARRRGRPALAAVFHDVVNVTMRDVKQQSNAWRSKTRRVRATIYKLKLAIEEGTRTAPVSCRLYVITAGTPTKEAREWFGEWWDRARRVAADNDLELLPNGWMDRSAVDAELYDRLIEVRNPLHH